MMPTLEIARLTFSDLVRRRVFVVLALFAVGLVLLSFPLRELTIGQWYRLITDVGLASTDAALSLLAIFLGASLIAGDLERKTLYPLLAKPVSRRAFVTGRFLGLVAVLASLALAMILGTAAMLVLARQRGFGPVLQAGMLLLVQAITIGGLSILFSSFTSTTLAATFGLSFAVIGHLTSQLAYFGGKSTSALSRSLMQGAARVIPNLEFMNIKTLAAHHQMLSWPNAGIRSLYGLAYAIVVVAAGAMIFGQRDLK